MDDIVLLRCKYCGAPLDAKDIEAETPYVTCRSCGTTQQRIDAKAYLDQVMGQVRSWVNSAMPGGFSMTQAENVDSVARHSIYVNNVKPRISAEISEYRFAANTLMTNSLFVMPFTTDVTTKPVHSSASAFEFDAKIKGLSPLAVDTEDRKDLSNAGGIVNSYALMINNVKLLQEDKPGRYVLMGNNFTQAAEILDKSKDNEIVAKRFLALAQACNGCEKLLNGDVLGSISYLEKGVKGLQEVKDKLFSVPSLAIMYQGVERELSLVSILANTVKSAASTGADAMKTLTALAKMSTIQYPNVSNWGILRNKSRNQELSDLLKQAIGSRSDTETIMITSGDGDYLFPFWNVDLRYSFVTGALWSKKSVEVQEDLLIPADFTIDSGCLTNPSSGVTDIFALSPEKSILSGLRGSETSISGGEGVKTLSETARAGNPGARKIIVPLSTKKDAEHLTENYLVQRMQSSSKLKLSKPYVKNLIYIPCRISGYTVIVNGFGKLLPERMKRTNINQLIVI
jgi:hypothetical protein